MCLVGSGVFKERSRKYQLQEKVGSRPLVTRLKIEILNRRRSYGIFISVYHRKTQDEESESFDKKL